LKKNSGWEAVTEQKRLEPLLRKFCRDGAEVTCTGGLFQVREAAAGNVLRQQ